MYKECTRTYPSHCLSNLDYESDGWQDSEIASDSEHSDEDNEDESVDGDGKDEETGEPVVPDHVKMRSVNGKDIYYRRKTEV